MSESTKRRHQARDSPESPRKRRRDRNHQPDPGFERDDVTSSAGSPFLVSTKKGPGRPRAARAGLLERDALKATRDYLENERPPVRDEDLDDIIGPLAPPRSNSWTQQDEAKMMIVWDASPEKAAYASITGHGGVVTALWKVCLRLFRCPPIDIISPLHNLRYQPLIGPYQPGTWSREFCNLLTPLLTHSIWQGSPERLAMALQYSVVCRTDDRRPWSPQPLCPALINLRDSMDKADGSELSRSVHHMHKEARSLAIRNDDEPSQMSNLLVRIHKTVKNSTYERIPERETSYQGFWVYALNNHDLRAVKTAIDKELSPTIDEAYELFKAEKGVGLDLPKASQLREFHERAGRRHLRLMAIKQRDRGADVEPEATGLGVDAELELDQPEPEDQNVSARGLNDEFESVSGCEEDPIVIPGDEYSDATSVSVATRVARHRPRSPTRPPVPEDSSAMPDTPTARVPDDMQGIVETICGFIDRRFDQIERRLDQLRADLTASMEAQTEVLEGMTDEMATMASGIRGMYEQSRALNDQNEASNSTPTQADVQRHNLCPEVSQGADHEAARNRTFDPMPKVQRVERRDRDPAQFGDRHPRSPAILQDGKLRLNNVPPGWMPRKRDP
ncbi:hypothetical protein NCS52_01005900 [Fusarium sp. LHS14.1]|nr:hypothetical protein NCS52_01005900 [Fusarium sp. LHS14.1]